MSIHWQIPGDRLPEILYCACVFLTKFRPKTKRNAGLFRFLSYAPRLLHCVQITDICTGCLKVCTVPVLCLRFSHQVCTKNKTECWPFSVIYWHRLPEILYCACTVPTLFSPNLYKKQDGMLAFFGFFPALFGFYVV